MSTTNDLRWRGLIHQISDEALAAKLDLGQGIAYIGFDPTSDSLHVGNLIQLLNLRRLQIGGNSPIVLAGGGTGMVGDPSGKSEERVLLDRDQLEFNVSRIQVQLSHILDFSQGLGQARLVNNIDWLGQMGMLEFLRDIGKHMTVNQMIAKDSVRTRLNQREQGISFTEFSYMLMQATDYLHLFDTFGCNLQMGASDQWGNITAGIDLIRKTRSETVYGLTSPLLLKSDGTKFGKSEQGAIFLDPEKTSPYEFYQFFVRADDASVETFLKFFTFLSHDHIDDLIKRGADKPEERLGQHALAEELTSLIHGQDGLALARQASQALFSEDVFAMDARAISMALAGAPSYNITAAALSQGVAVIEVIVASGVAKSRSEARKLIEQGGLYLNNVRVRDLDATLGVGDVLPGGRIIVRRGKKDHLAIVVS